MILSLRSAAVTLGGPGRKAPTAGEGLGLRLMTLTRGKPGAFENRSSTRWSRLCEEMMASSQRQTSYRSSGILCSLEQFCADLTRSRDRECQRDVSGTHAEGKEFTGLWTIKPQGNVLLIAAGATTETGEGRGGCRRFNSNFIVVPKSPPHITRSHAEFFRRAVNSSTVPMSKA